MGFVDDFREFWGNQSRNFKVFLVRDMIGTLLGNIGGRYGTIYMSNLGASAVDIGLLSSVLSLVRTLLSLPGGILTDRVKRIKRLYLTGRLLMLPVNLLKAVAIGWPMYFYTRVYEVMTFRITMPTGNILSIASITNRDRVRGLVMNRTVIAAIGLIAPILSAYAITYFGGLESVESFRPLFMIQFAVSIVVFLLLATQLEEPEFERKASQEGSVLQSTFYIFRQVPGLRGLLLLNVVRTFFMEIRMPLMQLYYYEVKNADAFVIAYMGTISTAVTLLLSVPMGNVADRVGRRKMGYISQVVYAACILAAIFTPASQPEWLLLYSFLSSVGGAMDVGWNAYIQGYIPLDLRGRWMGVNTMATALISIPAPIIGGLIWAINPDYLWWISFVFYLFLAIPLRMSIPEDGVALEEEAENPTEGDG
ncbi:MAG: MFS transporter [Candidatus Bathyarchaeota archaeon]|nr:MAG: MFS transporter [Candidatus Bathyarchaeota archaeon]